jgi:hypothetical protein
LLLTVRVGCKDEEVEFLVSISSERKINNVCALKKKKSSEQIQVNTGNFTYAEKLIVMRQYATIL